MAVNYLAYAQAMGARNPVAEGMDKIGSTLDDIQKNEIQRQELARRASLADLQMEQGKMQLQDMKDERDYRQGLKAAMANPATTTSITPDTMTPQEGVKALAGALPNALPGQPQEFAMQPEPVSPTVAAYNEGRVTSKTESPVQSGMKYAMSQGKYEDASKLMTVDDLMNKYAAHILQTGGDPVAYQQAMALRAEGKELADVISKFKDNPGLLMAAWPAIKKGYPGASSIDPETISVRKDGTVLMPLLMNGKPVEGKGVYYDTKGNEHIVDTAPKESKGFDTIDLGDRVKIIPRDGSASRIEKKGITPGAAARITINQGGGDDEDVIAWAKAVKEGRANLQDVPNRGTIRSRVVKMIEKGGGTDYVANKAENTAYGSSITQQQKQLGSMGSFVKNMDSQINKVNELSKKLSTFDTRVLNVPLRALRGRWAGSSDQAKYDMYLTEIESEIGKLATGSSASIAELSVSAQEKWNKIHDKNLSIKDMLELLKETRAAGQLRMKSVEDQLRETKAQMRKRGNSNPVTTNKDPLGIL